MQAFLACMQPYLTALKDLATLVSLTIAAVVAIKGLVAWRRQLIGTAEYDLAKRVLKAVYTLRDALAQVRAPFMSASEIAHAMKEAGLELDLKDPNYRASSTAATFGVRWKKVVPAFEDLQVEAVEAEALWGPGARDRIMEVRSSVFSLSHRLDLYLRHLYNPTAGWLDSETRQRVEKTVYSMTTEDEEDEFTAKLSATIAAIEHLARPHIESRRQTSRRS